MTTLRLATWFALLLLIAQSTATASTVSQAAFEDLVKGSELVFEGRVIAVEARFSADRSNISTYVAFEILDVVKGTFPARTIELSFMGGTAQGVTLSVSDMHVPGLGEKGIYFVESLSRRQIHPLYGWDQGRFQTLRREGDKTETIATWNGRAITQVILSAAKTPSSALSSGIAFGIQVDPTPASSRGMTVDEFKLRVREVLQSVK